MSNEAAQAAAYAHYGHQHPQQVNPRLQQTNYDRPQWDDDSASESEGTVVDDTPESRAGPAYGGGPGHPGHHVGGQVPPAHLNRQPSGRSGKNIPPPEAMGRPLTAPSPAPSVPAGSYALMDESNKRTNLGNTKLLMTLLSEMWIVHMAFILGGTFCMTFLLPQGYTDHELWNFTCYWKIGWLLPVPYTFICFFGLALPFRTPKFIYKSDMPKRRVDNLYILTVTKGDNRDAVYRAWNAHKHLERLHPCVRIHVLTDEPYFFENINCYTCPKSFRTANSKYKARALEWYRQTMRYTQYDWVLHLDEESVIDDESVRRVLEFIWFETECTWGQGVILYNQYNYWKNWFFTVADALRVGDDLSRFQLQYTYFRSPVFGAHGSFLLTNGLVENHVTWDLGSLTEDYQFAMHAMDGGFKCGKVPGIIREQSPLDMIGFMKQRRRWYVGIRRLPYALPKIWNTFWTLGILCLFCTLVSIPLGFKYSNGTPRWFGLMKDFSFCNFVYLYLIGIFVQDLDKRINPLLMIVHIPMTAILQFVAGAMEAISVCYGLLFPPADFDVIKK
ncbi:hypothetical protein HK097_004376 [Rhizophlyctis rosea]|uniref:Glycosyltransferase 2-like domain-containing protein n=1 Tax=Rhizophlyctis rosea TaxID=64517 RepID=A0AAD5SE58_9FUNG|nr:hypothetical protein HK097_004376 [Rhizophlyctis rosea]